MAHSGAPIDFSASFRLLSALVFGLTVRFVVAFDQAVFGLRVHGRRNLQLPRAFLVSNHSLCLDPALIAHAIRPRRTYFSALERTFGIPVLGACIRLLGAFPIPRERPVERLRAALSRALDTRGFVHFFPEGRLRPRRRDVAGFRDGVFLLSMTTGVPVIPLVVVARRRTILRRPARFLPLRIDVIIGRPLFPESFRRVGTRPRQWAAEMNLAVRAEMRAILAAAADRVTS